MCVCVVMDLCYCSLQYKTVLNTEAVEELVKVLEGVCMCVCLCVLEEYVCICMHACVYVYLCMCIGTCACTNVCVFVCLGDLYVQYGCNVCACVCAVCTKRCHW